MSLVKSINNLYKSSLHQKDYYNYYNCLDTKYYLTNVCEDLKDFIKKEKNRKDYCRKCKKQFIPNRFMDFHEYIGERNKLCEAKQRQTYLKVWKKKWLEKGIVVEDSFYERYKTFRNCERCNIIFGKSFRTIRKCKDKNIIICKKCLDSIGRE